MRTYKEYFFDKLDEKARLLRNRGKADIYFINVPAPAANVGMVIVRNGQKTLRLIEYMFDSLDTATIKIDGTSDYITYKYDDDESEAKAFRLCLPEFFVYDK